MTASSRTVSDLDVRLPARWGLPSSPALALPLLVILFVFFVAPITNTALISLRHGEDGLSLHQYGRFIGDDFYLGAVLTTLRVATATSIVCVIIGYPLALLMARGSPLQSRILMIAVVIPLMVNVVVRAYGWTLILGRTGILNTTLLELGLTTAPLRLLYNEFAVILGSVHVFLPLLVLPLRASIEKIDRRTEEAATSLGAGRASVFLWITFPQSLPGLAAGLTLVFSLTASSFVIPALLGGDFVKMLGPLAEEQILSVFDWEFGAAIAVVLTLLIGCSAALIGITTGRFVRTPGG